MLPDYLQELNPNQLQAAQTLHGPVLIKAGAGSGKTKTVIARIHNLIDHGIKPENILAITFTNKAAEELKNRLPNSASGVTASTIHSLCAKILRQYPFVEHYDRNFTILDPSDQRKIARMAVQDYIDDHHIIDKETAKEYRSIKPTYFLKFFGVRPGDDETFTKLKQSDANIDKYFDILMAGAKYYREYCLTHDMMDFDDLLYKVVDMLKSRPDVLKQLQQKYQYISVDEYQDTSGIQEQLVSLLAATPQQNLCVVGDPNQSIYAFRGADVSNILNFTKQYPNAKVEDIMQNYRSSQTVLDVANDIIRINDSSSNLVAANKAGDKPEIVENTDDQDEAKYVVEQIANDIQNGTKPSEIAVLYRMNSLSSRIEKELTLRGIDYNVVGSLAFYQRAEIKDLMAYLQLITNNANDLAFSRIVNTPARKIGTKTVDLLETWAKFFRSQSKACSLFDVASNSDKITKPDNKPLPAGTQQALQSFADYIKHFDLDAPGNVFDVVKDICQSFYLQYVTELDQKEPDNHGTRRDNVSQFVSLAKEFDQSVNPSLPLGEKLVEFLQNAALTGSTEPNQDGVQLMTVHASKGLEFDSVYIIGCENDIFPSGRSVAEGENGLREERRLMYVAVTRARQKLIMSYADMRMLWGQKKPTQKSVFLNEIHPDHFDFIDNYHEKGLW